MGLSPQRIDNLLEFLDKIESTLNNSGLDTLKRNEIIEDLRLEVIDVLRIAFCEGDRILRRSAIYGLSKVGLDRSMDFFIAGLNDQDEHVRGWAAEALGKLRDTRAIIPLIKALADENHYVCFNVAIALKNFPTEQLLNHLIRALQDPEHQIRRRVCKLMGELSEQRFTEALISTIKDQDSQVRYEAVEALRKLRNPAAILPLISALDDPSFDVRTAAIIALGSFGDERVIEPLVAMLVERKEHRNACIEALQNICGTDNIEPLFELIRHSRRLIKDTANLIMDKLYVESPKMGATHERMYHSMSSF